MLQVHFNHLTNWSFTGDFNMITTEREFVLGKMSGSDFINWHDLSFVVDDFTFQSVKPWWSRVRFYDFEGGRIDGWWSVVPPGCGFKDINGKVIISDGFWLHLNGWYHQRIGDEKLPDHVSYMCMIWDWKMDLVAREKAALRLMELWGGTVSDWTRTYSHTLKDPCETFSSFENRLVKDINERIEEKRDYIIDVVAYESDSIDAYPRCVQKANEEFACLLPSDLYYSLKAYLEI
jgi:hypothetical protein